MKASEVDQRVGFVWTEAPGSVRALLLVAGSQLLALTLWFSASAVAPQLERVWDLTRGQSAWLTLSVQIGFVVGALVSAIFNLSDLVASRRLFVASALAGAAANGALLWVDGDRYGLAVALRFATGAALAGVYPSGLKVMAGWYRRGRGTAMGILVGALTVGSAAPHLIRGLGFGWEGVVVAATLLTVVAAVAMGFGVADGPYEVRTQPFDPRAVASVIRNRGVRLATYGYLGHMWELYALWTWAAAFLAASAAVAGVSYGSIPVVTFFVIAAGGIGSYLFGRLADMRGRTVSAGLSMAISGTIALISPLLFGASPWVVVPLFLLWGFTVVADSAQFSAMVTETASADARGTALTLQTALGFLLTLVTIRSVPLVVDAWGWRWSFLGLAVGPALGVVAMVRLRHSPIAARLAGGRG